MFNYTEQDLIDGDNRVVSNADLKFAACDFLRSASNDFRDGTVAQGFVALCYNSLERVAKVLNDGEVSQLANDLAYMYVDANAFGNRELEFLMEGVFSDLLTKHREIFLIEIEAELMLA